MTKEQKLENLTLQVKELQAEIKELKQECQEPVYWEPTDGAEGWYINGNEIYHSNKWISDSDMAIINNGQVFKTREEAIIAMVDGKEMTSDEFKNPDIESCIYDKNALYPFRFIDTTQNVPMSVSLGAKVWRLRNYIPEDKELIWAYADNDKAYASLKYYDAKNEATFDYLGNRGGISYHNYAPFNGTPPPNMCKQEDLED